MKKEDLEKYKAELAGLVPEALEALKAGLHTELTIGQVRCIEMILRGSGIVQDGRFHTKPEKPATKPELRLVKVRFTTPCAAESK